MIYSYTSKPMRLNGQDGLLWIRWEERKDCRVRAGSVFTMSESKAEVMEEFLNLDRYTASQFVLDLGDDA